ncbi:thermonuclease family protein [Allopontixanthobacter confluentis]|nr:thermonuclease family protein [Allopontixanthobacter confluentis]
MGRNRANHKTSRRTSGGWGKAAWQVMPFVLMVALVSGWIIYDMWRSAAETAPPSSITSASPQDTQSAQFGACSGPVRVTCVVDGDTFWYRGDKIRIADIDTPETGSPACAREAELGRRATQRLQALLNQGPFTLAPNPDGRDMDRYGRKLRNVTRGGQSLGAILVAEGLSDVWPSSIDWCQQAGV